MGMNFKHWLKYTACINLLTMAEVSLLGPIAPPILAAETPAPQASLTIGTTKPLSQMLPVEQWPAEVNYLRALVSPTLVAVQSNWHWGCQICSEIPTLENKKLVVTEHHPDADATAVEKFMNKETIEMVESHWMIDTAVHWGDGKPVTGYDVSLTIQLLVHSLAQGDQPQDYPVERVNVDPQNPRKFVVIFKEPRGDFLNYMAISLLPSHKLTDQEKASPQTALDRFREFYKTSPQDPGLYYGNYMVKAFAPDTAQLVSNPGRKKAAAVPTIDLKQFTTSTALLEALGKGVDIAADDSYNYQDLERSGLLKSPPQGYAVRLETGPTQDHVIFNLRNPILTDSVVRQAIHFALNREAIAEAVYGQKSLVMDQIYHPMDPLYSKPTTHYAFNPSFAKRMLNDAGWIDRGKGIREKNGELLQFQIKFTKDHGRPRIAELMSQQLKKVGIGLELVPEESSAFVNRTLPHANFRDMILLSWSPSPMFLPWSVLHSREIPTPENQFKGANVGAFFSKEFDATLEDLTKEMAFKEQKILAYRLTNLYLEQLPTIPLFFRPKPQLIPERLKGYVPPTHLYPASLYISEWTLSSH